MAEIYVIVLAVGNISVKVANLYSVLPLLIPIYSRFNVAYACNMYYYMISLPSHTYAVKLSTNAFGRVN